MVVASVNLDEMTHPMSKCYIRKAEGQGCHAEEHK